MLIPRVPSRPHAWSPLSPGKRGLQHLVPPSLTRLGWFRLPPIDQYSSLLPPVGVWPVSQCQCGGPSSQNPYASSPWWAGGLPLRTPTHRRLGGPLPRQLANAPHGHPPPPWISRRGHAAPAAYAVLVAVSRGYPPVAGRSHTCYSPVRRSPAARVATRPAAPRLACVRPVASVHPEPGSNSPLLFIFVLFFFSLSARAPQTGRRSGRGGAPGFPARTPVSGFQFICAPVLESTRTRRGTHPS